MGNCNGRTAVRPYRWFGKDRMQQMSNLDDVIIQTTGMVSDVVGAYGRTPMPMAGWYMRAHRRAPLL